MANKVLTLGKDGRIALKLPGGQVQSLPEVEPACVYLLVDCSSSMSGAKILQAKQGALGFAEKAVKSRYSVGLVSFSDIAEQLAIPRKELATFGSKLQGLAALGSTNMTDALDFATHELMLRPGIRVIVIVTDGEPDSKESCLVAARRAKEAGIDIITIGTDGADQEFLKLLSTRMGLSVNICQSQLKAGISDAARLLPRSSRPHN
jgi:Mg-chelatase subunit ChlD